MLIKRHRITNRIKGIRKKLVPLFALFILTVILNLQSCKDDYVSTIPYAPVNLDLNLIVNYPNFRTANQSMEFEKPRTVTDRIGYGGILVYIDFDNKYDAWDMCCPYEADPSIKVHDNGLGQAVCTDCGTVYDLSWGLAVPIEGPSKQPLKRYQTQLQGNYLYVFN